MLLVHEFKGLMEPLCSLCDSDSGLQMCQMEGLGISTQRATFMTWDRLVYVKSCDFSTESTVKPTELTCFLLLSPETQENHFIISSPGRTWGQPSWWDRGTSPALWRWGCWGSSSCQHICPIQTLFEPITGTDQSTKSTWTIHTLLLFFY